MRTQISLFFLILVALIVFLTERSKGMRRVRQIEKSFLEFGVKMSKAIDGVANEHLRKQLRLPFDLIAINQKNELRWHPAFVSANDNGETFTKLENPNFYFYDLRPEEELSTSTQPVTDFSFAPSSRTVFIPDEFDGTTLPQLLSLYHELTHVTQDTAVRQSLRDNEAMQKYLEFYSGSAGTKPKIVLNYEATAYIREIELLNLALGGELAQKVKEGKGITGQWLLDKMKADEKYSGWATVIAMYADAYFLHPPKDNDLSIPFLKTVADDYSKYYDVWLGTLVGFRCRPMEPSDFTL